MYNIFGEADPNELVIKIEQVISDLSKLRKMIYGNLKTAHKYKRETLNKRRIEFYNKVEEVTNAVILKS